MTPIDAFHLPGLEPADVVDWDVRSFDAGVELRVPVLDPQGVSRILTRLRRARAERLADRPVAEVVDAVDAAAARLARPDDPARLTLERALPVVTGYSPPMVHLILERMLADWRREPLDRLLAAELGDPRVLDAFRPDPAAGETRRVRAFGPSLAFHVFAGNVPGVAVTSLVRSLLVKAATFGKTAAREPLFAAVFARVLGEVDPVLGECVAVTYWPGGTEPVEAVALNAADAVIVYGGREVADDLRRRRPEGTRLVVHGPRFSFGLVGREALAAPSAAATAERVARAVAAFDQQGCVSPHVVYVERGGEVGPERFAERVAHAFDALEGELPRGALDAAEAVAIHQLRGRAEFRAAAGAEIRLYASEGTEYTVIYDADPAFAPSCLNRVLWVKPLEDLGRAVAYVAPYAAYLQTVGLEGAGPRRAALAERLGRAGASRVTSFADMPWPPAEWHHDGRGPLRELLRWTDLEGRT